MKKWLILLFVSFTLNVYASEVKIIGDFGNWGLVVDGKPFVIKGFGCGKAFGKNGENYLKMAKELGANAVRTWGMDQGNKEYLDEAAKQGLKVAAGIWFNPTRWFDGKIIMSYLPDNKEKLDKIKKEVLDYVKKFKDHPAILYWSLGNEVIFFSKNNNPTEKIAFCVFIEDLAKEIKKIDPNHPVVYTSVGGWGLEEVVTLLSKYAPSIDMLVINQFDPYYEGIDFIRALWEWKRPNFPFAMGEYAPIGYWLAERDDFGLAVEETDRKKAHCFSLYIPKIFSIKDNTVKGFCLGGFAYHLGEVDQDSLSWWNINYGRFIRQQGLVIKQYYTGKKITNYAPEITDMFIQENVVVAGEPVHMIIRAFDREDEPLAYDYFVATAQEGIKSHGKNEIIDIQKIKVGPECVFIAPDYPGVYKIHAVVYDLSGHCAVYAKAFEVLPRPQGSVQQNTESIKKIAIKNLKKKKPAEFLDPVETKEKMNCM